MGLYHVFGLSHRKTHWTMSVDDVGLKICLWGTSNSMVTLTFFPQCRRKWPKTSSTTNRMFYKDLEWLNGP